MPYGTASAIEIDKKLRDDFRRRIKDFGVSAETADPVLAVLFRTFAQQLETLYSETGRMRLALLDELIAGLGIERRMARPAQTVVRFVPSDGGAQLIETGTEVVGEADTGERLTFRTDASIAVSRAAIALAATYQNGAMQLLGGVDMPEEFQNARPSLDPVSVNLGPSPAIFLAIQDLPPTHLDFHSIFFELGPDALRVQEALAYEPWCLAGLSGELGSRGILRPVSINAGVRGLSWLIEGQGTGGANGKQFTGERAEAAILPPGFYAGKVFVLPRIPDDRRFVCAMPRGMEQAIQKIFGREARAIFSQPRAWFRIGLRENVPSLENNVSRISLHAITASNVQCLNQTVYFERHGTSIPISREAGAPGYLVAPLSIVGESGADYLAEYTPSSDAGLGRYSIHNGRLELRPARRADASPESFANVRAWITNGAAGNRVGPGRVRTFLHKGGYSGITIMNPTAAAGGSDDEGYQQAQARFAEALLSRDRIITREDIGTAVRAFDSRIVETRVRPQLLRSETGLRRAEQVVIGLKRGDFADPEIEGRMLGDDLRRFLQARSLYDTHVAVSVEWS